MLARLEAGIERERGFVADAGHELRTPLALLRTELELALRHADSAEELRDAVRRSSIEVDRLVQLAEDLLLMAQSNAGRLALRIERLETADLLASTASRFEWRAQDSGRQRSPSTRRRERRCGRPDPPRAGAREPDRQRPAPRRRRRRALGRPCATARSSCT